MERSFGQAMVHSLVDTRLFLSNAQMITMYISTTRDYCTSQITFARPVEREIAACASLAAYQIGRREQVRLHSWRRWHVVISRIRSRGRRRWWLIVRRWRRRRSLRLSLGAIGDSRRWSTLRTLLLRCLVVLQIWAVVGHECFVPAISRIRISTCRESRLDVLRHLRHLRHPIRLCSCSASSR